MRYAEGVLKSGWIEAAPLAPAWCFLSACRVSLPLSKERISLISLGMVVSALNLCLRPIRSAKLRDSDRGSGAGV
ncbi:MAG: hypothetical protein FJ245_01540 [Nitrospira sp.]|nr:hypothetical protein [Nitrospira sp.]